MKTVSLKQVGHEELALPPRVQQALGELVGSAKEGLLALSVGVGLGCWPNCSRKRSSTSSVRRAGTTQSARLSVTATSRAR